MPTGSVQFVVDGSELRSPVTLNASGQAALTTSALHAGSHSVYAVYTSNSSGFANSDDSASPISESIATAATTAAVTSNVTTAVTGQSVSFTATISPISAGGRPAHG